jgi:AbrB family transcriptional regulator (stage V sporulation protein T)
MESRKTYYSEGNGSKFFPIEGIDHQAIAASPIISNGDVSGAVSFLEVNGESKVSELQKSLLSASAQFLGRQVE